MKTNLKFARRLNAAFASIRAKRELCPRQLKWLLAILFFCAAATAGNYAQASERSTYHPKKSREYHTPQSRVYQTPKSRIYHTPQSRVYHTPKSRPYHLPRWRAYHHKHRQQLTDQR
jgi:hypothetical protein